MAKYVGFKRGKVHERHVISEYYCGGCGYPVTDHDSFCPECGGAFRECDADDLEAENAKLRELVRGLDYCSDELNSAECERCPLYDPADPILEPKCVRMMREMGIKMRSIKIVKEDI